MQMNAMNTEYNTILSQVRRWPIDKKIALVEDVLHTLVPVEQPKNAQPKDTLSKASGLLQSDEKAPTDDEIDVMLARRRLEKYG
jgi:hypothetical protein